MKTCKLMLGAVFCFLCHSALGVPSTRIHLENGGNLNGQTVDTSNYWITVDPGELITGTIKVRTINNHHPGAIVPLGYTVTWGDRETQPVESIHWIELGEKYYDISVNKTAPTIEGDYYIVLGSSGKYNIAQVMSGTHAALSPVWYDGNDFGWDWSPAQYDESRNTSKVTYQQWIPGGWLTTEEGANWIGVHVVRQIPIYEAEPPNIMPALACTSVDVSPDGTMILARSGIIPGPGINNDGYKIYNASTYNHIRDCRLDGVPWTGLFSSDSTYFWTNIYYGGHLKKIKVSDCSQSFSVDLGSWTEGLAFDSQRRYLYVGENDPGRGAIGSLVKFDTVTETEIDRIILNGEPGRCIVVDPSGEYVYLLSRNLGSQRLYKVPVSGFSSASFISIPNVGDIGISVSPDGENVYVPHPSSNLVYVYDTDTLNLVDSWPVNGSPNCFFVSPDGTHGLIVTGNVGQDNPAIKVFDISKETIVQTISLDVSSYNPVHKTPYWDTDNGKVYLNLWASNTGVIVLKSGEISEPEWSFVHLADPQLMVPIPLPKDQLLYLAATIYNINKLNPMPDFILVSGDIADYAFLRIWIYIPLLDIWVYEDMPALWNYYLFDAAILSLRPELRNKVYAVPGNHDGYIYDELDLSEFCFSKQCLENMWREYDKHSIDFKSRYRPSFDVYNTGNGVDYTFMYKGFKFIGLDSKDGVLNQAQIDSLWGLNSNDHKIIFLHHPPILQKAELSDWRKRLVDYCNEPTNKVKLVLVGHEHRNEILKADGSIITANTATDYSQFVQTSSTTAAWDPLMGQDNPSFRTIKVKGNYVYPQNPIEIVTSTPHINASLHSSANLHIFDSYGNHVGIDDISSVDREIPGSFFFSHAEIPGQLGIVYPEKIIIFDPNDAYLYQVIGRDAGTYYFDVSLTNSENEIVFDANDIPTIANTVHQYVIDWDVLAQGGDGVIVTVDQDGDGEFERTIICGESLSGHDFSEPVDGLVSSSAYGLRYDRRTGQSSMTVMITNSSEEQISNPLFLVVESILPDTVTLVNPDGTTAEGKPYIDLSDLLGDDILSPGESVSKRIFFNNPNRERFRAEVSVYGVVEGPAAPPALAGRTYPVGDLPRSNINAKNNVNFADLAQLGNQWQETNCRAANLWCAGTDLNQDGKVDMSDILIMSGDWLRY